jgi:hypothetical protein
MRLCRLSRVNLGVGGTGVLGGGEGAEAVELPVLLRVLRTDNFFCNIATGDVDWPAKGAAATVGLVDLVESLLLRGRRLPLLPRCAFSSFVQPATGAGVGNGGAFRAEDSARARDLVCKFCSDTADLIFLT